MWAKNWCEICELVKVSCHQPNIYFRPSCLCVYKLSSNFPTCCSSLRGCSCECQKLILPVTPTPQECHICPVVSGKMVVWVKYWIRRRVDSVDFLIFNQHLSWTLKCFECLNNNNDSHFKFRLDVNESRSRADICHFIKKLQGFFRCDCSVFLFLFGSCYCLSFCSGKNKKIKWRVPRWSCVSKCLSVL